VTYPPVAPPVVYYPDIHYRHLTYHRYYTHRPFWWLPSYTYSYSYHSPWYDIPHHPVRWYTTRQWCYTLPYRFLYWDSWVRYRIPDISWVNGYRYHNDYPYYVNNGYMHRYSTVDTCDYELVDGTSNQVVQTFHGITCNQGYDRCAQYRDEWNQQVGDYQYFCSEKFDRDPSYNYNWNTNEDFYYDVKDNFVDSVNDPNDTYSSDYYTSYDAGGGSTDGNGDYQGGNSGNNGDNSWDHF
jgi:hypothetical protein